MMETIEEHPIENIFQCYPKHRGYCMCGQICKDENYKELWSRIIFREEECSKKVENHVHRQEK